jgi:hypothetical protein
MSETLYLDEITRLDLCYACGKRPVTAWTSETAGMCEQCRAAELGDAASLTGTELQTAMLTLRLRGHDKAANVFQSELVRRAQPAPVRHAQRQREAWRDHAAELPGWVSDDSPVLALAEAGWQARAVA